MAIKDTKTGFFPEAPKSELPQSFVDIFKGISSSVEKGTKAAAEQVEAGGKRRNEAELGSFFKAASGIGRSVEQAVVEPGSLFLAPLAEKVGLSPGAAAVIGLAGDFFAPIPGLGKVKAVKKGTEGIFDAATYVAENVAKREAAANLSNPGITGKVKDFFSIFKRKLVDSNAPIEDTLSSTLGKNKITLKPSEHITNAIDRVYRAPTLAGAFVERHGLATVIKKTDDLGNLSEYLIAKQAIDVDTRGFETGRDLVKDSKLIDALKSKYEPIAEQVYEYTRKLLDYSVDSGLVNRELAEKLKEIYPNYIPMNRVFNTLEKDANAFKTARGVANLSEQSILKKLQGSTREIEDPLISLMDKTHDVFVQGERNKTAKMLAGYMDLPGNPFKLRQLEGAGVKGTLLRNTDEGTISFLNEGTKEVYATTKEVAEAAKSLNPQTMNVLARIFAFPTRLARLGITGVNIPFILTNVVRDQVTAFINSSKGLQTSVANPKVYIKALFEAVGHGKLYREMVEAGGGGTAFDIARTQTGQTLKSIRSQRNLPSRIVHLAKNPSELLRSIEDVVARAEEFTRIKQFSGTKEALLKEGMEEGDAVIAAAKAAREDTVNFLRKGDWGMVLNSAFLYLNAGIQGTRSLLRSLKVRPVATSAKIATAVFTPIVATTYWSLSDPKRKEAYDDIAEYEKENNIIIIPPNPTKDERGRWNVIKIPISQEVANIANMPRRAVEQSMGLDPVRAGEVFSALLGSVEPIDPEPRKLLSAAIPQAVKPVVEAATNQNLFTGLPIVPRSLESLPPEFQFKDYTSGSARKAGAALGVSPLKVEAFIKGTVGGVGSQIINAFDNVLAAGGIIPKEQIGGESILSAIKRRGFKATGGETERKLIDQIQVSLTEQETDKAKIHLQAEAIHAELKNLPPEEANKRFKDLAKIEPKVAAELDDIVKEEKQGLTASDRFLKRLNVTNGARAKFIDDLAQQMKSNEERNTYVKELQRKGIVSDDVMRQLRKLAQNR